MPKGYANGMAAEGRLVVTGGVIGWDTREASRSADFVAQVRSDALQYCRSACRGRRWI